MFLSIESRSPDSSWKLEISTKSQKPPSDYVPHAALPSKGQSTSKSLLLRMKIYRLLSHILPSREQFIIPETTCRVCEKRFQRAEARRKHEWKQHRLLDAKPMKSREESRRFDHDHSHGGYFVGCAENRSNIVDVAKDIPMLPYDPGCTKEAGTCLQETMKKSNKTIRRQMESFFNMLKTPSNHGLFELEATPTHSTAVELDHLQWSNAGPGLNIQSSQLCLIWEEDPLDSTKDLETARMSPCYSTPACISPILDAADFNPPVSLPSFWLPGYNCTQRQVPVMHLDIEPTCGIPEPALRGFQHDMYPLTTRPISSSDACLAEDRTRYYTPDCKRSEPTFEGSPDRCHDSSPPRPTSIHVESEGSPQTTTISATPPVTLRSVMRSKSTPKPGLIPVGTTAKVVKRASSKAPPNLVSLFYNSLGPTGHKGSLAPRLTNPMKKSSLRQYNDHVPETLRREDGTWMSRVISWKRTPVFSRLQTRSLTENLRPSLLKNLPFSKLLRSMSRQNPAWLKSLDEYKACRHKRSLVERRRYHFRAGKLSDSSRGLINLGYPPLDCAQCSRVFTGPYRKGNFARHRRTCHPPEPESLERSRTAWSSFNITVDTSSTNLAPGGHNTVRCRDLCLSDDVAAVNQSESSMLDVSRPQSPGPSEERLRPSPRELLPGGVPDDPKSSFRMNILDEGLMSEFSEQPLALDVEENMSGTAPNLTTRPRERYWWYHDPTATHMY
ncbi:hypothetical protein K491DRAFT_114049 [Lophiostoma macrostomum CBS 122681]|uniref:C2H2-type domain-containing protein n=1 Tax=Lophiostoma macrostomum CBS 122681 TaxID=1314788 RepID=A0A6A6ST20_9PLEO|nr:hypothetical protein K491DRAFT_114049 [Lophiostoma macrostomum CBS 122681]